MKLPRGENPFGFREPLPNRNRKHEHEGKPALAQHALPSPRFGKPVRQARVLPAARLWVFVSLLGFLAFAVPTPAAAGFFDTFGADARGMSLGGAMAAVAEGWASTHYNPAALALSRDIEFSLGFYYALPNLKVEYPDGTQNDLRQFPRRPESLDSMAGPAFGLLLPVQRCTPKELPVPIAIGMGFFVPRQTLATVRVLEQAYPTDVIFNESNASLAFNLAVSTRITPAFYLGLGMATQLASGMEVQVSETGGEDAAELKVRFGSPSLVAGVLVRPAERIRIGLVYRQKNQIRSQWSAFVQTRITILPFGPDPDQSLSFFKEATLAKRYISAYTPENLSLGASYKITEQLLVTAELDWYRWSCYDGPLDRGLDFEFNDILVPRIGIVYRVTRRLEARGGFYYEPTPVTSQGTGFFPIGNDRFVPCWGLGYTFDAPWGILAKPIVADAYFQYHILEKEAHLRALSANPFTRDQNLTSSGYVINAGLSLTFRF